MKKDGNFMLLCQQMYVRTITGCHFHSAQTSLLINVISMYSCCGSLAYNVGRLTITHEHAHTLHRR